VKHPPELHPPPTNTILLSEGECVDLPLLPDDPVRVEQYVVIDKLGAGGFGTVYRAFDPQLERFVALKIVRLAGTGDATDRLTRVDECRAPDRSIGHVSRPAERALADRVDDIVRRLTEARVRSMTGQTVTRDTEALLGEARATGYAPLIASVAFAHGEQEVIPGHIAAAETAYRESVREAARAQWSAGWQAGIGALANAVALGHKTGELPAYLPLLESLADMERDDPLREAKMLAYLAQAEYVLGHQEKSAAYAMRAADILDTESHSCSKDRRAKR
jgi:hypothetical protein